MNQDMLRAAVLYAEWGWPVFPLVPRSKQPLKDSRGFKDATTDPDKIREWWARTPEANIGLACGDHVVVDVDVKADADGRETWHALKAQHGLHDETLVSLTPSGGMHLVYSANGSDVPNSAGKLGPGIDVRGRGGYIVLPPSKLGSGKEWAWEVSSHPADRQPAPLPAALVQLLKDSTPRRRNLGTDHIPEGQRNAALASLGGGMRRQGMAEEEILAALQAVNERRCVPPLSCGEVAGIAASIARYEPAQITMQQPPPRIDSPRGVRKATPAPKVEAQTRPAAGGAVASDRCGDLRNSQRYAAQHRDRARWCELWGVWLVWDGRRWATDDSRKVERLAIETVQGIYHEAGDEPNEDTRKALVKWAIKSEAHYRRRVMVDGARALLPVTPAELDQDPWLLNVNNGTLNLRTSELRPHRPEDMITKLAPVDYDPEAQAPTWHGFLTRIMARNEELISFLCRSTGYSLSGDTSEQVMYIQYGTGANGKTTFLEILYDLLGDYGRKTPTKTLLVKRSEGASEDVARLKGARLVTAVESEDGQRMAEALVKQLVGGDTIAARHLYGKTFEFRPEFKLWLATNHKPTIRGTDLAIWRRIRLIPFEITIPDKEQDRALPEKLRAELPGILAWAVRGCLEWQRDGLGTPPAVRKATEGYQLEMDVLGGWVEDCCIQNEEAAARGGELYQSYRDWCGENGERAISGHKFSQRLAERGFPKVRDKRGICYQGIGIVSEEEESEST